MLPRRARIALLAIVALGVAVRLLSPLHATLFPDGSRYALVGRSFAEEGVMLFPRQDAEGNLEWERNHHFSPLWPLVLSGAYRAFGYSVEATQWTGVAVSLLALGVAWWTTRRLLDADAALATTALLAAHPRLALSGATGNSEDLALLFFALTLLAVFASLTKPWWMLAAGAFASLAFLTRSATGALLVVAGLAGLAWRLRHRGARGVVAVPYLAGAAVFLSTLVLWTLHNVDAHWDGNPDNLYRAMQTSLEAANAQQEILLRPADFLIVLAKQALVFAALLAPFALAMGPALRRAMARERLRDETTSGLWLAVATTLAIGLVMGAAFTLVERIDFLLLDHERYVTFALLPLAWLAMRERPSGAEWTPIVLVVAGALVLSASALAVGLERGPALAADALAERMASDETVTIVGEPASYTLAYFIEREPRIVPDAGKWELVSKPGPHEAGERFEGSRLLREAAVLRGP